VKSEWSVHLLNVWKDDKKMDLDILDELSNLQWDRQLEPKEGEERFEF
jgi:hypothetical protein